MAITEKKIAQIAFTTSLQTAYTVPLNTRLIIKTFDLCNTTVGLLTATIHFVPALGSVSTINMIVPAIPLPGNSMMEWTGLQVLDPGATIQVIASGAGITMNMSGAESTF